ncbi:MAG TPA: VOC family protein [Kofleriaceae bacterium]|nr:VOC family protein [Kofleriaceae bacterium]
MTIDMNKKLSRPAGHHTVTPGFSVQGSQKTLEFLQKAFGAEVVDKYEMPNGSLAHCEVRIGDSVVMFGEAMPDHGMPAMPASLSLYVENGNAVDATFKRAVAAGGTSVMEPANQFYGYRSATLRDPGGNKWTICAVVEELTKAEIEQRMASQKG